MTLMKMGRHMIYTPQTIHNKPLKKQHAQQNLCAHLGSGISAAVRAVAAALTLLSGTALSSEWSRAIDHEIWKLSSQAGTHRWLIIHSKEQKDALPLYHVEVLERKSGEKPWHFKRLAAHMAITEEALKRSVIKPLDKGAVYPESYEAAYAEWKKINAQGVAAVCRTSVNECLYNK